MFIKPFPMECFLEQWLFPHRKNFWIPLQDGIHTEKALAHGQK